MATKFEDLGFFSDEIDELREVAREEYKVEFAKAENLITTILSELGEVPESATLAYAVGAGFWMRAIEACQSSMLLAERGVTSTTFATLRLGFECLFNACAAWRDNSVLDRMEKSNIKERVKQAKAMLDNAQPGYFTKEQVEQLREVAEEDDKGNGWDHHSAAQIAGLDFLYHEAYRGCSLGGAHATATSLNFYHEISGNGSMGVFYTASIDKLPFFLGLVYLILETGRARRAEFFPVHD
ncbi:DUF5677 domain-containing protein [Pseudomonas oryzihabitans]|uniref:DUF5677 domain-containing protein n=1 Tax=Pseudomonas oryzihabitans TaxID=47885 RepID=UPI00214E4541|nr:DUF5677 domain-containing protein [Pseudomonas psychrotolerans]UUW74209.1 DUF5677 domain-containing protein [Pseudomonas psychrotolerans]